MVVKYIQELRGEESDSIFFYADEALKIVAITMDSACWAVHMKNGDQTKKSLWP